MPFIWSIVSSNTGILEYPDCRIFSISSLKGVFISILATFLIPFPCIANQVTVKEGETLSSIALKHKVSLNSIITLNDINNPDSLEAGQVLQLPENASNIVISSGYTHKVSSGDSISSIANKYKVKEIEIVNLNNKIYQQNWSSYLHY